MAQTVIQKGNKRGRAVVLWYSKEVLADISKMTDREEREASRRVWRDARAKAPVGKTWRIFAAKQWMRRMPGTLRTSIKMVHGKYGGWLVWAGDMMNVFYAHFVEFGTVFTKKRKGERFLKRSVDAEKRKFMNALKRNLEG